MWAVSSCQGHFSQEKLTKNKDRRISTPVTTPLLPLPPFATFFFHNILNKAQIFLLREAQYWFFCAYHVGQQSFQLQAPPGAAVCPEEEEDDALGHFQSILGCTHQLNIYFHLGKIKGLEGEFVHQDLGFFRRHPQKLKLVPGKDTKQQTE